MPAAFTEIRDQFPTTILPVLYLGIPIVVVVISVLMFLSGYYFGRHMSEREAAAHREREEHIRREVERRIGGKPEAVQPEKKVPEKPAAKLPEKPRPLPPKKE